MKYLIALLALLPALVFAGVTTGPNSGSGGGGTGTPLGPGTNTVVRTVTGTNYVDVPQGALISGIFGGTFAGDASAATNFSLGTLQPTNSFAQLMLGTNLAVTGGTWVTNAYGMGTNNAMIAMIGRAAQTGTGNFTNVYTLIPDLASAFTNCTFYGQTVGKIAAIAHTPAGTTNIYNVGGNMVITAISGDTMTGVVQFYDEKNNLRTYTISANAVATGFYSFTTATITVYPDTDISVYSSVTAGSRTHDVTGYIQLLGVLK